MLQHSGTAAQQHSSTTAAAAHVQQHALNQHNEEPAEQSPITTQLGSKSQQQFQTSEKPIQARPAADNQAPQLQVRAARWRKPAGGPPSHRSGLNAYAAQQRSSAAHTSTYVQQRTAASYSCTAAAAQQLHSNCNTCTATQQHMLATAGTLRSTCAQQHSGTASAAAATLQIL